MPKRYSKKPAKQQDIAKRRIAFLFQNAKDVFKESPAQADKYVKMARRIAMKHKIRLSSKLKRRFCRNCSAYLVPGANCRVRLHKSRIIYYCLKCRHYSRIPVR